MTTFDDLESSAASSRPVELVTFAIGGTSYRYTTGPLTLTVGGLDYEPEAISRGNVVLGNSAHDQTVVIDLPATNAFARLFVNVVPAEVATCTIMRVQRGESPSFATTAVLFKGRVKAVKFSADGHKAQIGTQSLEAGLNKQMLAFTFQAPCNHQLYSPGCGADPGAHTYTGTVTAVSGNTITVSGLNASGMDFVSGYVTMSAVADFRTVLSQSGDILTLLLPFATSPLGTDVSCVEGCDHLAGGDCATRFDNVLNFGGWPFVPTKNPFATTIV